MKVGAARGALASGGSRLASSIRGQTGLGCTIGAVAGGGRAVSWKRSRMRARIRTRSAGASGLLGLLCLLGVLFALWSPVAARAGGLPTVDLSSDPWFVGWSALLPPGYLGVDTDSSDACVGGQIKCVDRTARRLERQLSGLGCHHNSIFSLAYARTTEKVAAVERAQPTLFSDTPWLNHYDATFADMYFSAWN